MTMMNAVLSKLLEEEQYVTGCYAVVNRRTRTLSVVNAAHPPVVAVSPEGVVREIEAPGDILGKYEKTVFGRAEVDVTDGERIYLCTDGCFGSASGAGRDGSGWGRYVMACAERRDASLEEAPALVATDVVPDKAGVADDRLLLATDV
jgi:sigma-B regulation protein RsbU (phosphoserine phosphatase)